MYYWSNSPVPTNQKETGTDTQQRLVHKELSNNTAYAVATTSYALLSYLLNNEPAAEIDAIQGFLQQQRDSLNGFASTEVRSYLYANHTLYTFSCLYDGTAVRSGAGTPQVPCTAVRSGTEIGLLSSFDSAFSMVCH